jgi:hypothetical protein
MSEPSVVVTLVIVLKLAISSNPGLGDNEAWEMLREGHRLAGARIGEMD